MNIRYEITRKIEEKKYSIRQLDRITGVSHTTIRNFLDGKKIKINLFLKLIDGLDFSIDEEKELIEKYKFENLTKGENDNTLSFNEIKKMQIRLKELEKSLEIGNLQNKIPVYGCVSAGTGYAPDAEPIDWISMNTREHLKGVLVNGESMEPTIFNKSVIFFKEDVKLVDGDIGIFILEGEGFIKRFFKKKGIIVLDSDNSEYAPIIVNEYDDFKICGKVIKVLSNV